MMRKLLTGREVETGTGLDISCITAYRTQCCNRPLVDSSRVNLYIMGSLSATLIGENEVITLQARC